MSRRESEVMQDKYASQGARFDNAQPKGNTDNELFNLSSEIL